MTKSLEELDYDIEVSLDYQARYNKNKIIQDLDLLKKYIKDYEEYGISLSGDRPEDVIAIASHAVELLIHSGWQPVSALNDILDGLNPTNRRTQLVLDFL